MSAGLQNTRRLKMKASDLPSDDATGGAACRSAEGIPGELHKEELIDEDVKTRL